MKRVITIQHCQSEQHVNGMMGGWNDWELTELGREQARRIGERLAPFCRQVQERPEDTIVLVSHGGALSVWNILWLGLPPEVMNSGGIFGRAGAIGEFDICRGWEHRILRVGDISYIMD